MTGPEHYREAERLLAEANEFIRFRQQPLQSGPADLPERPEDAEKRQRLSRDPGLPERNIAEAQVHATLARAAAALEPPRASYAPRPEPAAPDVPFIPKPTRVEIGGAYKDPEEHGSLAGQVDRVAPAHLLQRDGVPQIPGTDSGSLMPDRLLPAPPWQHVQADAARDRNADTASRSGAQPPDTAPDVG